MAKTDLSDHPAYSAPRISKRPYVLGLHPDVLKRGGYMMEMKVLAKAALSSKASKAKFLIMGRPRSGTTLLKSLLDQVDDLTCEGEMLHDGVLQPRRFLNGLARKAPTPAYGCKLLSYQLVEVQRIKKPAQFLQSIQDDGFKLVHIERDTVDQVLSLLTAMESRAFSPEELKQLGRPDGTLTIDPALFKRALTTSLAYLDLETKLMERFPHLHISYERDLNETTAHQATTDKICDFIGIASSPVKTEIKKRREGRRADRFTNYAELGEVARSLGLK